MPFILTICSVNFCKLLKALLGTSTLYKSLIIITIALCSTLTSFMDWHLKKKTQVILSALRPLTCNSMWPQHTLQMFADHYGPRQTIPWETINQGLLQPQGELYPIQTILSIAAGISSSSFVRVSTRQSAVHSLSKGISSTLNFHESIGTDRTRTRNLSHPKRAPYRLS